MYHLASHGIATIDNRVDVPIANLTKEKEKRWFARCDRIRVLWKPSPGTLIHWLETADLGLE
jgi:hypothetical protein